MSVRHGVMLLVFATLVAVLPWERASGVGPRDVCEALVRNPGSEPLLEKLKQSLRTEADPEEHFGLVVAYYYGAVHQGQWERGESTLDYLEATYGEDHEIPSMSDLDDLFVECPACEGQGSYEKACGQCRGSGKCSVCGGRGNRTVSSIGGGSRRLPCTNCNGTGKCSECKGSGDRQLYCRQCRGSGRWLPPAETKRLFVDRLKSLVSSQLPLSHRVEQAALELLQGGDRDAGFLVYRKGDDVFCTLGEHSGILPGDELEVHAAGRPATGPQPVAWVEVASVEPKISTCRVIKGALPSTLPTEGDSLRVVRPSPDRLCLVPGDVVCPPDAPVADAVMRQMVSMACQVCRQRAGETDESPTHHVNATVSRGASGWTVELTAVGVGDGRILRRAFLGLDP